MYKSSTTFYPISKGSFSTKVLLRNSPNPEDYLYFGESGQVKNYLEILRSSQLKKSLVQRFNLMEHYGIDRNGPKPHARLAKKYQQNFSFTKTEFMSIKVKVFDKDPQMAAMLANGVVDIVDSLMNSIKQNRASKAVEIVKRKYEQQKERYNEVADSIQQLSDKGLVHFESQSEALTETLGDAKLQGRDSLAEDLKKQLAMVGEHGPIYHSLTEELIYIAEQITNLHTRYLKIQANANAEIDMTYLIDKAHASKDIARPNRLFILIITLISTFIITFVLLNIYENWKAIKAAITE